MSELRVEQNRMFVNTLVSGLVEQFNMPTDEMREESEDENDGTRRIIQDD